MTLQAAASAPYRNHEVGPEHLSIYVCSLQGVMLHLAPSPHGASDCCLLQEYFHERLEDARVLNSIPLP